MGKSLTNTKKYEHKMRRLRKSDQKTGNSGGSGLTKGKEEHFKRKKEVNPVIYGRVVKKNNIENSPSVSAKINVSD